MFIQDWSSITGEALQGLWFGFEGFILKLIGAILVFIIGWIVAVWLGRLIGGILKRAKFDKIFEKTKWDEALEKADVKVTMSGFVAGLVKWILVVVFLSASVEILGMDQFAIFLGDIVGWLPNLIVAVAIFVVAVIVADFSEKLIKAVVGKMSVGYVNMAGSIVRWAIWIFAIFAILEQLEVASDIVQILVTGFVALIVLSGSIALGLGGKDLARESLENLRNKTRD